jgi:hypothetical protein
MAFTASLMPDIVLGVNEIFNAPNTVDARYSQEVGVAPALLTKQTARTQERLTNGTCVGIKVWFYDAGASNTIYEGSELDSSLACDNGACGVGQTAGKDIDNNIFFHDCKAAQEDRCNNELDFATETARVLYHLMYNMRVALSKRFINTLMLAAQQNQVVLPSYMTERSGSNIIQIDKDNFTDSTIWNTIVDLGILAQQNGILDPIILNGRNFQNSSILAQFNGLNDNERSQPAIYNTLGRNMVWDIHSTAGIDAITTELSTILVSPNTYLFWNYTLFPTIPVMKDPSINLWNFSIADPILRYNANGVIRPVMYDVEHTYECTGYDSAGNRIYLHNYRLFLRGGFTLAPLGYNMAGNSQVYTGTMHFVQNANSNS